MPEHDLFSKRDKPPPDVFQYDHLPATFRTQVLWVWHGLLNERAFARIRRILCEEHGKLHLCSEHLRPAQDLVQFLLSEESPVGETLDAIELSMRLMRWCAANLFPLGQSSEAGHDYLVTEAFAGGGNITALCQDAVDTINCRFRGNAIGYEFRPESERLVRVDSLLLHREVVVPALALLAAPAFKAANAEFLEAHQHFRHAQYPDCLTKCCAAFESTIKIICHQKGWAFDPNAPAARLVDAYMAGSGLPNYFGTLLMIIATMRNKLGPHGKGTTPVVVPEHFAKYALHTTAAAILLLADHAASAP
ncbi:MAG: hypothetical protein ABSG86_08040 [Thermoguttaceae bacterium]|jgi:hypothetical protein